MEFFTLLIICALIFMGVLAFLMPFFVYRIEANTSVAMKELKKINEKLAWMIDRTNQQIAQPNQPVEKKNQSDPPPKPSRPQPPKPTSVKPEAGPVTLLPDDPKNPTIAKVRCNACKHVMPYAKRLSGKDVTCRSCGQAFQLP